MVGFNTKLTKKIRKNIKNKKLTAFVDRPVSTSSDGPVNFLRNYKGLQIMS